MQLLSGFKGRINRALYWGATGILILAGLVSVMLQIPLVRLFGEEAAATVGGGIALLTTIPGFAIIAKRLHDRDLSASWKFIGFAPLPLLLLGALLKHDVLTYAGLLVSIGLNIRLFVQIGCLSGTVGPNRFGPDPLDPSATWA